MSSKSNFNIKDSVNKATAQFLDLSKKITSDRNSLGTIIIWILIILLFVIFIVYVHNVKYNLMYKRCGAGCGIDNTNCILGTIFTRNGAFPSSLQSINNNSEQCKYFLRDYYILTAFNCCSGGNYKNDYVGLCNLIAVISQGVRCLDFEMYSLNNQPIIATSSAPTYMTCYKESYNSIAFNDVMTTIQNYAYSNSTCPNPTDPIIMHLRIKSANCVMLNNLASLLENYDSLLLGPEYSYDNSGNNLGAVPLLWFSGIYTKTKRGKIIIIVNAMDNTVMNALMNSNMWEYVNMVSGSTFMQIVNNSELNSYSNLDDMINNNMLNMTMVIPDSGSNPSNPNFLLSQLAGCQMCAMRFQLQDTNFLLCTTSCINTSVDASLNTNPDGLNTCFNNVGYAFVLKPSNLRYVPTQINDIPDTDESQSYGQKTTSVGVGTQVITYNY
jgi:hypothetical protein